MSRVARPRKRKPLSPEQIVALVVVIAPVVGKMLTLATAMITHGR